VCAFVHRNSFDPKGTIFIERISPAYGLLISSGSSRWSPRYFTPRLECGLFLRRVYKEEQGQ
jgi:hypothetical protein